MRFEKEINIYGDEVILKRFLANETSIDIVQGKISAMLSESELVELQNSGATMYSKLASAIMDIDALSLNFSDLTTKYNTVSGQYSSLESKVAEYKLSVDGLSFDITQVRSRLTSLETWKNEASLKITDSAIVATVTESSSYKASVESLIEQKASSIRLKADRISWESTYSSLTEDGTLSCINAVIEGTLHSKNQEKELYIRNASLDINYSGIYVGNIGTSESARNNSRKGLQFGLDDGSYMAWAIKETGDEPYIIRWCYAKTDDVFDNYEANTLHAGCDINLHGFKLKNATVDKIISEGVYGANGYLPVVVRYNSSGVEIESVYKLKVSNGIIISGLFEE